MSVIELSHLGKSFGDHAVLHDISFSVQKGDVISIIGSSGSGKSTALRCINLLEKPSSGQIFFHGKDITAGEVPLGAYRAKVTMVFQNFNLFNHMSVLSNCTEAPRRVLKISKEEAEARAEKYLAQVGMSAFKNARPRQLSGGQKQRVAIARALCMEPEVILFDEPTSALDPELTGEVLRVIKELKDAGRTMILVTHEMGFARSAADKVIFMADGVIEEYGTPEQVFGNPVSDKTKSFLEKSLENIT